MAVKKKIKYFNNGDKWMLAEDIPDIDFHFSQIWLSSFVNDLEKTVGINYKKILSLYHGYNLKFYYGEKDSNNFANHVLNLIIKNSRFGENINNKIRLYSDKLKNLCKKIDQNYLKKLSNIQLLKLCLYLDDPHTTLYTWGWLPNAVDMFHGNLTNYLKSELSKKLPQDKINIALVNLTASPKKSVLQEEHESFLKIVAFEQKGEGEKITKKAIDKHLKKYFYLKHLWIGREGIYDYKYYIKEINKFIKSGENARELLAKENKILRQALNDREIIIEKLRLDKKMVKIFNIYAEFAVTKLYRRDVQIYWAYKMDFIFMELSKRLKIPIMQIRFMFPEEIYQALKKGRVYDKLRKELRERMKFCVYYAKKGWCSAYAEIFSFNHLACHFIFIFFCIQALVEFSLIKS